MMAATPTPKPGGEEPSGKAVFTTTVLDAMIGDPAQAPYRNWEQSGNLQITEYLFVHDQDTGNPMTPYLAEDWEVSSDGKKVTIGVKKGIPWYTPPLPGAEGKDFGTLSAEDVVWFLNHNNSTTNPDTTSGDAGDLAAVFGEARVVDMYTLEIDIVSPIFFGFPLSQFGVLGAAPSIRSKEVFDQMGNE
jgi:ABC-type transport system substrate-binding protein